MFSWYRMNEAWLLRKPIGLSYSGVNAFYHDTEVPIYAPTSQLI